MASIGLVVPTLNAGDSWRGWLNALAVQSLRPHRVLVVDSSSDDQTAALAREAGHEVIVIRREDFNHGTTRQMAANVLSDIDFLVYLTQDAILHDPASLQCLCAPFNDASVGAAYGRQIPHRCAGPFGSHARQYNYREQSEVRSLKDVPRLGIKTAFISNAFSAYRVSALRQVGGFPSNVIFGEDTIVAARLLLEGWKVAYCADAAVRHSHDYSFAQEFRRYFDIGVLHARESWIRNSFGAAEGEGRRFVVSEISYLARNAPWLIPSAVLRTGLKYSGFKLGLWESKLPLYLKRQLGMYTQFWKDPS